jgi:hypothetical protein
MILGIPPQCMGLQLTVVHLSKCMTLQDCYFPHYYAVLYVGLTKTWRCLP